MNLSLTPEEAANTTQEEAIESANTVGLQATLAGRPTLALKIAVFKRVAVLQYNFFVLNPKEAGDYLHSIITDPVFFNRVNNESQDEYNKAILEAANKLIEYFKLPKFKEFQDGANDNTRTDA